MNENKPEQPQPVFKFRGISKPVKTHGKFRGATAHGDFIGYKRKEWVEYCNGECGWIYMVELMSGERFEVRKECWDASRPVKNA